MPGEPTVGSIQTRDLLSALRSLGADCDALARQAGVVLASLADTTVRVPASRLIKLLELAEKQLHDPLVGLHAGARVESRGLLFYLLMANPQLADGLRQVRRFGRLGLDTVSLEIEVGRGLATFSIDPGDAFPVGSYHPIDYVLRMCLNTFQFISPGFQLQEVRLMHDEVGAPGETARTFGCPVRFGCDRNALRFPESMLQTEPITANPAIAEQIEKLAASVLDQMVPEGIEDRVAIVVRTLLVAGVPADRAQVATRLHVSERTLQRQLEHESATFTAVRDRVRSELAQALLSNLSMKVETVAWGVGFDEVASFSKAFTRWYGCSPTAYRQRLDRKQRPRS